LSVGNFGGARDDDWLDEDDVVSLLDMSLLRLITYENAAANYVD
jgi:hypothetical protein